MFDIEFVANEPELQDEGEGEEAWLTLRGRITLGDYREDFLAPIGYWSRADYERQWLEAARRLLAGLGPTGFFTSTFQLWWVMWREGDAVYVHERLLLTGELPGPFDPADPYRWIGDRHTTSEDGQAISEWRLGMADISGFVERRARQDVPA